MSMHLMLITQPFTPHLGAKIMPLEEEEPVGRAITRSGWPLRPNVVLLKPGVDLAEIDWKNAKPADIMVKRSEWDALTLEEGQSALLVALPGGGGGGGSNALQVVAQLALIVAASLAAPGLGGFLATTLGIGTKLAAGLAGAAILIGGKVLLSAVLPAASPASQKTISPTYSLNAQTNEARLGAPIPELFGSFNITCDLAAYPYSDFRSGTQQLYALFCLGRGEYLIEEMRLGSNVFAQDNAGTPVSIGVYPEISWEIIPPGGTVTLFPPNVATSTEVNSIPLIGFNEDGWDWTPWFVANPPNTTTNMIAIDIGLPGGLIRTDGSGDNHPWDTEFVVQARKIDVDGNVIGSAFSLGTQDIRLQTVSPQRLSFNFKVPPGRYQVRAVRTTDKATSTQVQDTLVWLSMRAFLAPLSNFGDVTLIALKYSATKNINANSTDQFNVLATRKLPIYDAVSKTWSAPTATRSIAWAAAYIARKRFSDINIDLAWLAKYDAIWAGRGDFFDGVFDTPTTFWPGLQNILSVGRAQPVLALGKLTFVRDEPKTIYRTGFSSLNMVPGSFQRQHQFFGENDVEALLVQYVDRRDWKHHSVLCKLPGSTATADTATPLQMIGVSQYNQAWREGMFKVASSHYRRIFSTFNTELDGRVCFRGDKAKLAHWSANWGGGANILEIEEKDDGDLLTLSEPWSFTLDPDGDPVIVLTAPDGQITAPVPVTIEDDGATSHKAVVKLLADAAPTQGKYAGLQPRDWNIWADSEDADRGLQLARPMALLGQGTQAPQDVLVVSMAPAQSKQAALTVVVDDPRVHTADAGDPPAEAAAPALTPVTDIQINSLAIDDTALNTWTVTVTGAPDAVSFSWRKRELGDTDWTSVTVGAVSPFVVHVTTSATDLEVKAVDAAGNSSDWFPTILS